MILSTARATDHQLTFWQPDKAFRCMAQTRNWAGDFFEEATASLLRGTRLKTDSRADVCPDILIGEGLYCESKSVGKNGAVIVYQHRLAKDVHWTAFHSATLLYCIWHHNAKCTEVRYLSDLRQALTTAHECCLVPLEMIHALCQATPLKTLCKKAKPGMGYGNYGYKDGYLIRLSAIKALCTHSQPASGVWAYGCRLDPVTIYTLSELKEYL